MKNKAILVSSIVLLLSACTFSNESKDSSQNSAYDASAPVESNLTPEQAEEQAKQIALENRATFAKAVSEADPLVCEVIVSYDLQFSCRQNAIFQSAVQKKDKSICSQLETDKGKEDCKATFQAE